MADELQTTFKLRYSNGGDTFEIPSSVQLSTAGSSVRIAGVQAIGTSEEALALGEVATDGGAFYAKNLDATNYVEIGLTGSYVIKLLPGQFCFLSGVSNRNLYARANTASVNLQYALFT